jgi:hypothetical protein
MTEQHHAFDAFDKQCEGLRDKWLRHRAKPEVWAAVEKLGKNETNAANCALELRARVEALEAALRAIALSSSNRTRLGLTQNAPESSDSLVEQVANGIAETFAPYVTADKPARAVIHTIADWLDQQELHVAATRLRMEVEQ